MWLLYWGGYMLKLRIIVVPALFLAACTARTLPEKVDPPKQPRAASSVAAPEAPAQG